MSNAIKRGMYKGENPVSEQISLDKRLTKISTGDTSIDVPSIAYVKDLENQILELRKRLDILDSGQKHNSGLIKRLTAGIRKVDSKIR